MWVLRGSWFTTNCPIDTSRIYISVFRRFSIYCKLYDITNLKVNEMHHAETGLMIFVFVIPKWLLPAFLYDMNKELSCSLHRIHFIVSVVPRQSLARQVPTWFSREYSTWWRPRKWCHSPLRQWWVQDGSFYSLTYSCLRKIRPPAFLELMIMFRKRTELWTDKAVLAPLCSISVQSIIVVYQRCDQSIVVGQWFPAPSDAIFSVDQGITPLLSSKGQKSR